MIESLLSNSPFLQVFVGFAKMQTEDGELEDETMAVTDVEKGVEKEGALTDDHDNNMHHVNEAFDITVTSPEPITPPPPPPPAVSNEVTIRAVENHVTVATDNNEVTILNPGNDVIIESGHNGVTVNNVAIATPSNNEPDLIIEHL